jgi:hypothetical protein
VSKAIVLLAFSGIGSTEWQMWGMHVIAFEWCGGPIIGGARLLFDLWGDV